MSWFKQLKKKENYILFIINLKDYAVYLQKNLKFFQRLRNKWLYIPST